MRGQVYEIDDKKWFTFGGAKSQDQAIRIEGKDWWPGEMASEREYEEAVRNLAANGWKVDYVVTHCAPTRTIKDLGFNFLFRGMKKLIRGTKFLIRGTKKPGHGSDFFVKLHNPTDYPPCCFCAK